VDVQELLGAISTLIEDTPRVDAERNQDGHDDPHDPPDRHHVEIRTPAPLALRDTFSPLRRVETRCGQESAGAPRKPVKCAGGALKNDGCRDVVGANLSHLEGRVRRRGEGFEVTSSAPLHPS
jgi:hypothetical protein